MYTWGSWGLATWHEPCAPDEPWDQAIYESHDIIGHWCNPKVNPGRFSHGRVIFKSGWALKCRVQRSTSSLQIISEPCGVLCCRQLILSLFEEGHETGLVMFPTYHDAFQAFLAYRDYSRARAFAPAGKWNGIYNRGRFILICPKRVTSNHR